MINLVGFLLPPLIDLINRRITDTDARFWVSVLVCSLVGILQELIKNGFTFTTVDPFIVSILAMFGLAQLAYKGIYEDSRMQDAIRNDTPSEKVPTAVDIEKIDIDKIELPKI